MKKFLILCCAIIALIGFVGCVAEKNGQIGLKGLKTGHVYTKEDYKRYKKIFDDGKHVVLEVKKEIETVKSNSSKTDY